MLEILPLATNVIGDQGLAILEIILMRNVKEIQVLFYLCIIFWVSKLVSIYCICLGTFFLP